MSQRPRSRMSARWVGCPSPIELLEHGPCIRWRGEWRKSVCPLRFRSAQRAAFAGRHPPGGWPHPAGSYKARSWRAG